jgi:probable F420-dependent oxidoreductase
MPLVSGAPLAQGLLMNASAGRDAPMTLGVSVGRAATRDHVLSVARMAEEAGFDVLTAADHLGNPSPFGVLAAAAAVTQRIRLRTYVLDLGFHHPALLARDAATLDALSGGRFELGVGAGHMRHEHVDAGLPFPPHAERVARSEAALVEVVRRLASPDHVPAPVQQPVPVVVGGWSAATLAVAARHAGVVALGGLVQVPGQPAGTFRLASAAETDERMADLGALLAEHRDPAHPAPVLDALLQRVVVDRPPEETAGEIAAESEGRFSAAEVLDSPFLLIAASPDEGAAELERRRQRWGISSWMTHDWGATGLAAVRAHLP